MVKALVLQRSNVAASWSCILENAQGNATRIYRSTAAPQPLFWPRKFPMSIWSVP
jgi:hypothetical protein